MISIIALVTANFVVFGRVYIETASACHLQHTAMEWKRSVLCLVTFQIRIPVTGFE